MLGKIEGRRRRGRQIMRWLEGTTDSMDMRWLDDISNSMDMTLSKLQEMGKDWLAALDGVVKSQT